MLQVGIVGAGIAGLSAAIALARAGHDVEIFEKSRFTYETGAAITAAPNGTRILSKWGFDFDKAGAVECTRITRVNAETLEIAGGDDFKHVEATYGSRWCFFHRADLHAGLRALTEALAPKVRTRLGQAVADIDIDVGTIRLANGTEVTKDLIVVADGVRSTFMAKLIDQPYPVLKSPLSIYRFLVPFEQMVDYPETKDFFADGARGFTTFYKAEIGRPGPLFNAYGCRSSTMVYCGVMHPSKPKEKDLDGWVSPASVEDVLSVVKDFHPAVQAICRGANDLKVYTNMWRNPIETYSKGKAIFVGDACHLMLPTHAQGACQALEDAMALEVLFTNVGEPEEIQRSVQAYSQLRVPRVSAVQTMSNKMKPGMEKSMLEEVRLYWDGPLPGPQAKTMSKEYSDFFFTYDVAEEARKLRG